MRTRLFVLLWISFFLVATWLAYDDQQWFNRLPPQTKSALLHKQEIIRTGRGFIIDSQGIMYELTANSWMTILGRGCNKQTKSFGRSTLRNIAESSLTIIDKKTEEGVQAQELFKAPCTTKK